MSEKTLCIIKPDAVQNNFVEEINKMIKQKDISILKSVRTNITSEIARKFYAEHSEKPFFNELVDFITSGPSVVQVLQGEACISNYRDLMGATNPKDADDGTIRKEFALSLEANSVHGSDSLENAKTEISFFFSQIELVN